MALTLEAMRTAVTGPVSTRITRSSGAQEGQASLGDSRTARDSRWIAGVRIEERAGSPVRPDQRRQMINFEERSSGPLRRLVQMSCSFRADVTGASAGATSNRPRVLPAQPRAHHLLSVGLGAACRDADEYRCPHREAAHGSVLGLPDGDRLVVIASNYGRPTNPGWYHNLLADPRAVVSWEGSSVQMQARELKGDERRAHIARGLEAYPWWEQYHRRAAPREIPVIMLEPLRTSSGMARPGE